jgi:hypothetical protein
MRLRKEGGPLLNVPRHFSAVFIVMDFCRRFFITRHGGLVVVKTWVKIEKRGG